MLIQFIIIIFILLTSMTLHGSYYSSEEYMLNVRNKQLAVAREDPQYLTCIELVSNFRNGYRKFYLLVY